MMTQIRVQRRAVSKTRAGWAREGGAFRRYSAARARTALQARRRSGWVPVIPPGRSRHERITVLHRQHPLADVARAYRTGQCWFERGVLETCLGARLDGREGARLLASAGFAIMSAEGARVELRAADPRAALLINRARLGPQRRGYKVLRIVEAFLALLPRAKHRRAVTDERRLEVALQLQQWMIDGEELLECRRCARLHSVWTF